MRGLSERIAKHARLGGRGLVANLRKQRTMAWGALGIVLAGACAAWALGAREGATIVTVKPSETYQVMTGWEVTARGWEENMRARRVPTASTAPGSTSATRSSRFWPTRQE